MKLFNSRTLFNQAGDAGQGGGGGDAGQGQQGQQQQQQATFREQVFQPDGSFSQDWHRHLGDEFKDAAPQLSRFKSFGDLTKSFLHGQKQLSTRLQPPDEKSSPEQIRAWRDVLGLPADDAPEWNIAKPERLPDGVEWNEPLANEFAAWAKANNISPKARDGFLAKFNEVEAQRGKSAMEKAKADAVIALQKDEQVLRESWGKDFDSHKHIALKAAATAGLPANHYSLTDPDVMKAFHKLALATGERPAVGGINPTLGGDPATQARLIQTDPSNPNYAAYHNPQHPNYKAVREMVFNLNKQVAGG